MNKKKISPARCSSTLKDIARMIVHKERGDKVPMFLLKFEIRHLMYDNSWSNYVHICDTYYHSDSYMEDIGSILYDLLAGTEQYDEIYHIKLDVYNENNEFFNWHQFMVYLKHDDCILLNEDNFGYYRDFHVGDIVRHFKYGMLNHDEKQTNKYTYKILDFAQHTETKEMMVVYESLYSPFRTYVRPYKMFMSEIDHAKYPNAGQVFRFYKVPTTLT